MDSAVSSTNLSEARRLTGVFHEPGTVFPDIAANGRWWIPMLLVVLCTSLFVALMVDRVGYDRMIQKAFESSKRAQEMPAEQRQAAMDSQRKMMPVFVRIMPPLANILGLLIVAGGLLFTFKFLLDVNLSYKNSLNITCYASIPPAVAGVAAMIAVMYLKPPDEFDAENALAFNAGAFMPEGTAKWLHSIGSSLDLFTFWSIALLAIGFSAAAGAKKLPFSRALIGVIAPWLVWVVCKAAFAALFR